MAHFHPWVTPEIEPAVAQIETAMEFVRAALSTLLGDANSTHLVKELGAILDDLDNTRIGLQCPADHDTTEHFIPGEDYEGDD